MSAQIWICTNITLFHNFKNSWTLVWENLAPVNNNFMTYVFCSNISWLNFGHNCLCSTKWERHHVQNFPGFLSGKLGSRTIRKKQTTWLSRRVASGLKGNYGEQIGKVFTGDIAQCFRKKNNVWMGWHAEQKIGRLTSSKKAREWREYLQLLAC